MTQMITEDVVQSSITTEDHEGPASHIVFVPLELRHKMTPQQYILKARVEAIEVEALCGYKWIPSRNPAVYPLCSKCLDIYKSHDQPDRDQLPDA